jgi:superfamily II DNA or RNA helicase
MNVRNFQPIAWQRAAADAWVQAGRRGVFEVATGLGKTYAALTCIAEASTYDRELVYAVVVPRQELAHQWAREICAHLDIHPDNVGMRMAGRADTYKDKKIIVWVIDSARAKLASIVGKRRMMLVVDECHNSGSRANRKIYDTPAAATLGLSATAARPREVDEDGVLVPVEEQAHMKALGPIVYRLTVSDAQAEGLLPPFEICHHGVSLSPREMEAYAQLSQQVSDAIKRAGQLGVTSGQVPLAAMGSGRWTAEQSAAARGVQAAILARKHFLYLRPERNRVTEQILRAAFAEEPETTQAITFNERIEGSSQVSLPDAGAEVADLTDAGSNALFEALLRAPWPFPASSIRMTHSRHADAGAVAAMRLPVGAPERARVLLTVKGATEGVDLPGADLGVVVASSTSVLQRIQTLGRILRPLRHPDGRPFAPEDYADRPPRRLHVLYVKGTADEEIYQRTDWDELLGEDRNRWFVWDYGAPEAVVDNSPPLPPMTEDEAWAWVQAQLAAGRSYPFGWPSRVPEHQPVVYSGNEIRIEPKSPAVHNSATMKALVASAAHALGVKDIALRSRMSVTRKHRLVLRGAPEGRVFTVVDPRSGRTFTTSTIVLGQLAELPRIT